MSLLHIGYFSTALQKQMGMNVVLPDGDGPFRTVYQLHGLSDDYTMWLRRSNIERYAEGRGLLLVMPDGGRSFYTDMAIAPGNYEQHIIETVRFIDRTFRTIASPQGRAIGGLSMGGYGAMKLGLKYPDIFNSVASHSSVFDIVYRHQQERAWELQTVYGDTVNPDDDPFALAAKAGAKPALYFDCGVDDFLIEDNRKFHAHLDGLGLAHEYHEYPGAHSWDYWDTHVPAALDFHLQHFTE